MLFPVSRSHLGHSIAFIALLFWAIQLISGFFLLGLLSYDLDLQFSELISIVFHGNYVWLLRLIHMLGANFVVISTIVHMAKSAAYSTVVSPTKFLIWFFGAVIFLLSLATAFTGYVVVSGNMSFWAALVILNLFSVIPFFGEEIVNWVLGSTTVVSWGIRRFTFLHFLLAIIAIALVLGHIVLLHRNNPQKSANEISDAVENLALILVKDFVLFLPLFLAIFADSTKALVHPDNWQGFSRLLTPTHIEPEAYFLWTFSAIKLHNGKIAGVVFLESLAAFSW